MPPFDVEPPLREGDPFLDAVVPAWEPVYAALGAQDAEALTALSERYPAFREAYGEGKVGHHLLIARSDDLPKGDAFELVAASAERLRALGYSYMVTEATHQWTGAAFEALGGVRVHFAPFQKEQAVPQSAEPLEGVTTSPNGLSLGQGQRGHVLRDPSRLRAISRPACDELRRTTLPRTRVNRSFLCFPNRQRS
jgi:hypothetical protein